MRSILPEDGEKAVRMPLNPLILDVVKNEITFMCSFDSFTYKRSFLDPEIKSEGTYIKFKVNGHRLKLLHEGPTLEEEIV